MKGMICKILSRSNKINAINTLAVCVFSYSTNLVKMQMSKITKVDTETRKLLTMERMNQPAIDMERLYLARESGEWSSHNLSSCLKQPIMKRHEISMKLYSVSKGTSKFYGLELPDQPKIQQKPVAYLQRG